MANQTPSSINYGGMMTLLVDVITIALKIHHTHQDQIHFIMTGISLILDSLVTGMEVQITLSLIIVGTFPKRLS